MTLTLAEAFSRGLREKTCRLKKGTYPSLCLPCEYPHWEILACFSLLRCTDLLFEIEIGIEIQRGDLQAMYSFACEYRQWGNLWLRSDL